MVDSRDVDSQILMQQASEGDERAADRLLELHRDRLRAMIALRLDRRLSARIDPSDVMQETMVEAHRKLPDYLQTQPIPFYPWLRRLAWEKIVHIHRQHLSAQARTVTREERYDLALPDQSAMALANRLIAKDTSPSRRILQSELKARVQSALSRLDRRDREVLVLRYLEQLSLEETAASLDLSLEAVKSRQRRALNRFAELIDETISGDLL
jgi:RNA polymerase sigma-70 factor (ECF subfamily)